MHLLKWFGSLPLLLMACARPVSIPPAAAISLAGGVEPHLSRIAKRPSDSVICLIPLTTKRLVHADEGVFVVLDGLSALATVRVVRELPAGTDCEFGERGYAIEVVDGALSDAGGDVAVGPLEWSLSGDESYVWTGEVNALGLGPIDIFLLDLDGDAVADFKVSRQQGENLCISYMALVRVSGPWEWRPVGAAREACI